MLTTGDRLDFLLEKFPSLLLKIDPETKPEWGKFSVMQMIEHMFYAVRMANGKDAYSIITPEEKIAPMQEFLMSEKEFRPNTKNVLMGEEPEPQRLKNVEEAVAELKKELNVFHRLFKNDPEKMVTNPFFGELNFQKSIHLLYKHAIHHLKQFKAVS